MESSKKSLASVGARTRYLRLLEVRVGPGALPVPKHARLRHDNSSPRGRWGAYPVLGVHVLDRCLGHCMASMHPCREYGLGLLARAHVPGAWARALTRTHVF